ncbi:response regulator transcription factor [Cupriavidus pauculus]|uniref:response regulator transcription factor n=1 Tax=Cupriavidus pauculus TaxID=82633 RepID=UPI001EE1E75B|nr:helix-turn-helix transcriptional regulator [Cupriavidus pauculus]GJG98395.1 response regulator transcription factor [Cupriavidus pauculus]
MPTKLAFLLIVFPAYQAWDLYQLFHSGADFHVITEAFATLAFVAILYVVIRERRRAAREFASLKASAEAAQRAVSERDEASKESTRHFLQSMQQQFDAWRLTPSEKDVALLLVKGLSLEEIAQARECGAKTVRQHAANVYAKAKLNGRHQLAAYFLEDLLVAPSPQLAR